MLNEPETIGYKQQEREDLAKLGYASVEAMNKDDKDITILQDSLDDFVNNPYEVHENEKKRENSENQNLKTIDDIEIGDY